MTASATIRSPDKLPKSDILNQETGVKPGPDNNLYTGYLFTGCNGHHDRAGLPGSQADITGKAKVPVENTTKRKPRLVRNLWIE